MNFDAPSTCVSLHHINLLASRVCHGSTTKDDLRRSQPKLVFVRCSKVLPRVLLGLSICDRLRVQRLLYDILIIDRRNKVSWSGVQTLKLQLRRLKALLTSSLDSETEAEAKGVGSKATTAPHKFRE